MNLATMDRPTNDRFSSRLLGTAQTGESFR